MGETFEFLRPPEAPTFCPTEEEWADPLGYINKIRPKAETYGICKIRPPASWQPPFAVDVDSFKFTPRVQRLNELEAPTRIKLNFLDQIAKFFELQGTMFKIPMIEKKALDLYTLHQLVAKEGGMEKVNSEKKWNRLAIRLGLPKQKNYGPIIRNHFEKILYPFVIFQEKQKKEKSGDPETPKKGRGTPMKSTPTKKGTPTKGSAMVEDTSGRALSAEVKRLAFYGPGPKMAGYVAVSDPLAQYICLECGDGESEDKMLLCDGCDDSYHTFCLNPPLQEVPKGEWRCPRCVAEDLRKPGEAFGFEQATREYTLSQFGQMADAFKGDYFNMPLHKILPEQVELEFWRIVSAIDEDVTVEYGADLHTMDHGSGFPTVGSKELGEFDKCYVESGWNLNNLPNLEGSVLGHISADISGMKVPWMYVGMMFSTFCWHNEDHWSYSINYLHWGEAKTWYGVPGEQAPNFEEAMKKAAPELFQSQPDLLHQLVTIMNPNILMRAGVPVYRMDQEAGEFIITFPRAYHAGFNQGYNFAEAVNFAPADWLAMGRECVEHYSMLHRYCVFSHDELICAMANAPDKLDMAICLETYRDFKRMIKSEFALRQAAKDWGVMPGETVLFENLNDDERLCDFCKTTSFLSCITCDCTTERQVCLRHYDKLCDHSPNRHQLKVRYGKEELLEIGKNLFTRVKPYLEWLEMLKDVCHWTKDAPRIEYDRLKTLVEEGLMNKYPREDQFAQVHGILRDVDKMKAVIHALLGDSHRTRHSESAPSVSLRDLAILMKEMAKMPVNMPEISDLKILHESLESVRKRIEIVTHAQLKSPETRSEVESLSQTVAQLPVRIPEVEALRNVEKKLAWLDKVQQVLSLKEVNKSINTALLERLVEQGRGIGDSLEVTQLKPTLQALFDRAKDLERHVNTILCAVSPHKVDLDYVQRTCDGIKSLKIYIPYSSEIESRLEKALKIAEEMKKVVDCQPKLLYHQLLEQNDEWDKFPIALDPSIEVKRLLQSGKAWKSELAQLFCKFPSPDVLIATLTPKKEVRSVPLRGKGLLEKETIRVLSNEMYRDYLGLKLDQPFDLSLVEAALKERAQMEVKAIRELREKNYSNWVRGIGLHCVCQEPWVPTMLRCECCYEWFHPTCIPNFQVVQKIKKAPKAENESGNEKKYVQQTISADPSSVANLVHAYATGNRRFLGPCCGRSARPRHDLLIDVVTNLGLINLEFPEGLAVLALARRAIAWHDRAGQVIGMLQLRRPLEMLKAHGKKSIKKVLSSIELDVMLNVKFSYTEKGEMIQDPRIDIEKDMGCPPVRPMVEPLFSMEKPMYDTLEKVVLEALLLEIDGNEREEVLCTLLECTRSRPISTVTVDEYEESIRQELIKKNIPLEGQRVQLRNTAGRMANQSVLAQEGPPPKKRAKKSDPKKEPTEDVQKSMSKVKPPPASSPVTNGSSKKMTVEKKTPAKRRLRTPSSTKKKLPRKVVSKKPPVKAEVKEEPPEDDEEDEEDELCSAVQCKRPATLPPEVLLLGEESDSDDSDEEVEFDENGKKKPKVVWVMCETCGKWFHVYCVGLTKRVVKRMLSYECEFCCDENDRPAMTGSVDGPVVQALQAHTTNVVRVKEEKMEEDDAGVNEGGERMEGEGEHHEPPPSLIAASELRGRSDKENAQMAKLTPQRKMGKEGGGNSSSS